MEFQTLHSAGPLTLLPNVGAINLNHVWKDIGPIQTRSHMGLLLILLLMALLAGWELWEWTRGIR